MSFLSDLAPGEVAYVEQGQCHGRRLTELGLIGNTKVECVAKAPFGDTKAYLIRGAVIALRRSDALNIRVQRMPHATIFRHNAYDDAHFESSSPQFDVSWD